MFVVNEGEGKGLGMLRSEDKLVNSVVSSYFCVGSGDETQAVRLGDNHLYVLSYLHNPEHKHPFLFSFFLF